MNATRQIAWAALAWLGTATLGSACSGGTEPVDVSGPRDEVAFPINPGGNPFLTTSSGCTPFSCEQLGVTCGESSDGCGNALNCDNGVQDGGESGIDCGGTSGCGLCPQGSPCTAGNECESGYCVDTYCCDTACDQTCEACDSSPGSCQPVSYQLTDDTCLAPQACDGTGQCLGDFGATCSLDGDCLSNYCDTTTFTCG